ncbi:HNH endonuclease [Rhodococcus sp. JT-3]|uniref:HNH endonuclease n=1 Tax=Rhodococcus sp. JT-3 TaxID=1973213 RepID=UPI0013030E90|nr:HNH endonuclease [Rhodococcus sp. JT-3]
MSSAGRSGHRWRKIRANHRAMCQARNAPCWLCGQQIDYDAPANAAESYEADHFHSVSTHPQLANDPENLRPSHSGCNRSRGNKAIDTDAWVQSEVWD